MAATTTAAPPAIIRVRDLSAGYGDRTILRDVSFDVARGEIVVILGGSGSGKSTLMRQMIGLYRPWSGSVEIDGADIVTARGDRRRAIQRRFGVMYQSGALFGSMTVLENVCLPLVEFTELAPGAIQLIGLLKLQLVGLEEAAGKMPSELSGGMIKRAAIARAMALDPDILFLDEPSAGLDPITGSELDELVLDLRDSLGVTFVVVTHEMGSVYTIADRVILLDGEMHGVAAIGPVRELADSPDPRVRGFFHRRPASGPDRED